MIHRTADEIANEIRMTRSQFLGVFLIVEGRDDRLLMQSFVSTETCTIEVAEGKENVCSVVAILDEDHFDGVLGIVDADFDRVEGIADRGPNLVMPECHDLMAMLVRSPALDRTLGEFGSRPKLESFREDVLEALVARALPLGYLRLYSLRAQLPLRFSGLDYSAWVDRPTFGVSTQKLIEEVKNLSQRHDLSSSELAADVEDLENLNYDPREICSGTDLVGILSIGLRGTLGSNNATQVSSERLKSALRLAYSTQHFLQSELFKDIKKWQDGKTRFQVLLEAENGAC